MKKFFILALFLFIFPLQAFAAVNVYEIDKLPFKPDDGDTYFRAKSSVSQWLVAGEVLKVLRNMGLSSKSVNLTVYTMNLYCKRGNGGFVNGKYCWAHPDVILIFKPNPDNALWRKQWTVAHEMGHMLLRTKDEKKASAFANKYYK